MLQSLSSAFIDEERGTVRLLDSYAGLGSYKANWQIQAKSNFYKTMLALCMRSQMPDL